MVVGFVATGIIADRAEGMWNRTLLAGVRVSEILSAQIGLYAFLMLFYLLEVIVVASIVFKFIINGSIFLLCALLVMQMLTGIFFGIFLAVLFPKLVTVNAILFVTSSLMMILSGN